MPASLIAGFWGCLVVRNVEKFFFKSFAVNKHLFKTEFKIEFFRFYKTQTPNSINSQKLDPKKQTEEVGHFAEKSKANFKCPKIEASGNLERETRRNGQKPAKGSRENKAVRLFCSRPAEC